MKAIDIYEAFIAKAGKRFETTCDGIIYGDKDTEVTSVATCFAATADVIREAAKRNVSLLICHEPMCAYSDIREEAVGYDVKKWELLDESGLTVLRLHDYAHTVTPDYIHDGFIRKMGLKIKQAFPLESLGIRRYELEETTTARSIAALTKEKLGAEFPRIVGEKDTSVRYICLALGGIGLEQLNVLERGDTDLLVTGEIQEVVACNYLRDMTSFGIHAAMLLLGHFTAEWAGMEKMASDIQTEFGIPCEYIHSGEVY